MIDSFMSNVPWPLQGIIALAVVVLISWWMSSYAKAKRRDLEDIEYVKDSYTVFPIHPWYYDSAGIKTTIKQNTETKPFNARVVQLDRTLRYERKDSGSTPDPRST